jgi:ABC-2 type transport system permease protein
MLLRPYLAVITARFRMLLQYRVAALAGFATQLFWGLIKLMVFAALYRSVSAPLPMTFEQLVVYVWLGQALLALLPWNVDGEIAKDVRSGRVAYELLRPLDLYGFWFARTLAFRAAPTLLRMIPMIAFAYLGLPLFPDWVQPLLYWQPFRGLADVPFRIYSGHLGWEQSILEIGVQWMWVVVVAGFGYWLLSRALRNLVVQGG